MNIKTRFAPSPTGALHLGGARTAIFNWLFARANGGEFLLRIEDTDKERSTEESINEILDGLSWLGLDWDNVPEKQSDRLNIYSEIANKLISEGKAYKCYVTPEELDAKRKQAQKEGRQFRYNREWADKGATPEKPFAIRILTPDEGSIQINDLLRGNINFNANEFEDFVILKADGFPTYNFATAVDDAKMGITHILRGDDHLINTPKQKLVYEALKLTMPKMVHISMILGSDKSKLSKRHGATSIMVYKNKGYLPDAMVNYLARLGWSYGDQEIFSKDELIEKFSLDNIGKSAAVFNPEKLEWLNSHYIREKSPDEIADLVEPLLIKKGYKKVSKDKLQKVIEQLTERSTTLNDIVEQSHYFFSDDISYEEKARDKFLTQDNKSLFELLINKLSELDNFNIESIQDVYKNVMEITELKLGKIAQPTRVALTGGTVSPGIFEVMEILGKETVLKRLKKTLEIIR